MKQIIRKQPTLFAVISALILIIALMRLVLTIANMGDAYVSFANTPVEESQSLIYSLSSNDIKVTAPSFSMFSEDSSIELILLHQNDEEAAIGISADRGLIEEVVESKGLDVQKNYHLILPEANEVILCVQGDSEPDWGRRIDLCKTNLTINPYQFSAIEGEAESLEVTPGASFDNGGSSLWSSTGEITVKIKHSSNMQFAIRNNEGELYELDWHELEALDDGAGRKRFAFSNDGQSCTISLNVNHFHVVGFDEEPVRFLVRQGGFNRCKLLGQHVTDFTGFLTGNLMFHYYSNPTEYTILNRLFVATNADLSLAIEMITNDKGISPLKSIYFEGGVDKATLSEINLFPSFSAWFRNQSQNPIALFGILFTAISFVIARIASVTKQNNKTPIDAQQKENESKDKVSCEIDGKLEETMAEGTHKETNYSSPKVSKRCPFE